MERNERQVAYTREPVGGTQAMPVGRACLIVTPADKQRAAGWIAAGFNEALRTPDATLVFVSPEKSAEIRVDQQACMGCLSACRFSNWAENDEGATGKLADPRSYCIQKTLQSIAHDGDVDHNLMFAGHNAYRFAAAPSTATALSRRSNARGSHSDWQLNGYARSSRSLLQRPSVPQVLGRPCRNVSRHLVVVRSGK